MAQITGSLASVNSVPTEGTVLLRALDLRPGSAFAVTGEPKITVIQAGRFTIEDVEPGPAQLTIQGNGVTHDVRVDVPDEDEVDFLDLLDDVYDWEPAQISAVKLAAREARKAADEAGRIASAFRGAEQLEGWAESASGDASAAAQSAGEAASSAEAAAGSAAEAADSASAAAVSAGEAAGETSALVRSEFEGMLSGAGAARDAAGVSEANAAQSEAGAAGHADLAEQHKTAAELARDDAAQSKSDAALSASSADGAAGAAATSASNAAKSESSAAAHAQDALGYAGQAEDARDESRTARDEAVQAAENAQQGAPSDGWKKTELSQPVQDSLSRADTALQSMPVATEQAPGAIRLSGDLGGTAQAPTVPGLAGKADAVHTHSSSQVDGLDAALARLSNIRAWFRGEGPPPASIPGAQVGDWWLDTSAMELHEITGV